MIRNLTPEEYQQEKIRIVTLMFNPPNANNGDEYIKGQQVAKDKIKNRIDYQLNNNFIPSGADFQSDVYQDLFENLLKLNEKNTAKFVNGYYQNPNSAYWFAFYLLKIKSFAVDKNYPKKPISSAKKMMFGSAFDMFNTEFGYQTEEDFTEEIVINDDG